jgi:hypothetical protein
VLELTNETPFQVERAIQLDPEGGAHWVVIAKSTYAIDPSGRLALADVQEPVCTAAEFRGEAGASSLLREVEMTYAHPGTDVIVQGTAYAPGGYPVRELAVRISAGPLRVERTVVGDRVWWDAPGRIAATDPVPFESMPLPYERAYGGDAGNGDFDPRNPVGKGHVGSGQSPVDRALPNLEHPARRIRSPGDRPKPAGLGAVAAHWLPRRDLAGTYDASWQAAKAPLYPDDFQVQFFSCASEGLHAAQPFVGGEAVRLEGLTRDGLLAFAIPREVLQVDTWADGGRRTQPVSIARIIVEPDARRLIVVRRSSLYCGARARQVKRSLVTYKPRVFG